MIPSVVKHKNQLIGHSYIYKNIFIFFGNRFCSLDLLKKLYSDYKFQTLKQVHGTDIVEAPCKPKEADGMYTSQINTALTIVTADCLPVFYKTNSGVVALHCGWRSIEKQIGKTSLNMLGPAKMAWIGPHIPHTHFEVGNDVANKITKKYSGATHVIFNHADPNKKLLNLSKIIQNQINIPNSNFFLINKNTLLDDNYNSHRRSPSITHRNLSFIVINK